MYDFSSLELSDLYDLLSAYTTNYTKGSPHKRTTKEFIRTKGVIKELQQEIQRRNAGYNMYRDRSVNGYVFPDPTSSGSASLS